MIFSRKKVAIAILLFGCVLVVGIVAVRLSKTEQESKPTNTVAPFFIEGLSTPAYKLRSDHQKAAIGGIEVYLKEAGIDTKNLTGTVRKGSFSEKVANDRIERKVTVDFAKIKRTYIVSSWEGSNEYNGLYILCPKESELVYESFACTDDVETQGHD